MECEDVRRQISDGDGRVLRGRRVRAHLRDCAACERFVAAIPARQADLRAFAPLLPPAAAAAVLSHVSRAVSGHAAGSASSVSAASTVAGAGAAGKAAGTLIAWKTPAAGAVALVAVAGVAGLAHLPRRHHSVRHMAPAGSVSRAAGFTTAGRAAASARPLGGTRPVPGELRVTRASPGRLPRGLGAKRPASSGREGKASGATHGSSGRVSTAGSAAAAHGAGTAAARRRAGSPRSAGRGRARNRAGAVARIHKPKRASETRSHGKAGGSSAPRPARRTGPGSPTRSGAVPQHPRGTNGEPIPGSQPSTTARPARNGAGAP
jgi:hypothetical protein